MAHVIKINHIAIAVSDIEAGRTFWEDILGLTLHHVEDVPEQNAIVAFFPLGDTEVELVQPTLETSGTAKFLAEKGPGIHHLCFEVDDIGLMMDQLKEKGIRVIDEKPVELQGRKVAFIHPKSTGGVLLELFEKIG